MTPSKLPRLELTEDPNKNNNFIIYRHFIKGTKNKQSKSVTKKYVHRQKHGTRKRKHRKGKK
jgi:hypothetical protein